MLCGWCAKYSYFHKLKIFCNQKGKSQPNIFELLDSFIWAYESSLFHCIKIISSKLLRKNNVSMKWLLKTGANMTSNRMHKNKLSNKLRFIGIELENSILEKLPNVHWCKTQSMFFIIVNKNWTVPQKSMTYVRVHFHYFVQVYLQLPKLNCTFAHKQKNTWWHICIKNGSLEYEIRV